MRPARYLSLLVLLLLFPALTACGVAFKETFDGTEVFKGISLNGNRTVGEDLTLNLTVTQTYPVPITIGCFYEDTDNLTEEDFRVAFHERAKRIGNVVMPPATSPIERKLLTFDFKVEEPGNYFLACLTPASADNGLGLPFTIQAPEASTVGR